MTELFTTTGLRLVAELPAEATRPPVLFVHGMAAGAWHFERWQPFFAARGWPTYAVDLRGHGGSRPAAELGRVSVRDYVADAREALAEVERRHPGPPPAVVGHSMGGLIAQKVAELDAPFAAALLCAAPPRGIPVASWPLIRTMGKPRYLGALLRSRPLVGTSEDLYYLNTASIPADEWAGHYPRFEPESGRAGREMAIGMIGVNAALVRCPVLVVAAGEDRFVPPRVARALARRYDATLRHFPGHGHLLLLEPGWEGPAAAAEEWLATVADRRAGR